MPLSRITSNGLTSQSITAGTYGGANNVPVVTVGTDGRISAVSNTAISIPSGAYLTNSNNGILTTNTSITGNVTANSTTLSNAVNSDSANLASAQMQNQGLGKMTTLANALNNPATAGFATAIINPTRSGMIQGLAVAMIPNKT